MYLWLQAVEVEAAAELKLEHTQLQVAVLAQVDLDIGMLIIQATKV
jgi:hypothetical protein